MGKRKSWRSLERSEIPEVWEWRFKGSFKGSVVKIQMLRWQCGWLLPLLKIAFYWFGYPPPEIFMLHVETWDLFTRCVVNYEDFKRNRSCTRVWSTFSVFHCIIQNFQWLANRCLISKLNIILFVLNILTFFKNRNIRFVCLYQNKTFNKMRPFAF